ncbi:MAG TPA: hypothetical protein O0X23_04170, partial [Methanocorpusculum sp.]|nr:hypothetical protein [Methanocorpusculum sp.]
CLFSRVVAVAEYAFSGAEMVAPGARRITPRMDRPVGTSVIAWEVHRYCYTVIGSPIRMRI